MTGIAGSCALLAFKVRKTIAGNIATTEKAFTSQSSRQVLRCYRCTTIWKIFKTQTSRREESPDAHHPLPLNGISCSARRGNQDVIKDADAQAAGYNRASYSACYKGQSPQSPNDLRLDMGSRECDIMLVGMTAALKIQLKGMLCWAVWQTRPSAHLLQFQAEFQRPAIAAGLSQCATLRAESELLINTAYFQSASMQRGSHLCMCGNCNVTLHTDLTHTLNSCVVQQCLRQYNAGKLGQTTVQ